MRLTAVWFVNKLKQSDFRGLPLMILTSLLVIMVYLLKEINGLRSPLPFFAVIFFSLFFNSLLLKTRWSLFVIFIYNLPLALFFCLQLFGKVFFTWPVPGFFSWLTESNLLVFVWLERLNYWAWHFLHGNLYHGPYGWPVFLLLQLWLTTAWLWFTYHQRISVWWGIFLPSALVGFWVQQEALPLSYLILTLFCSFLLITISYYQKQQRFWDSTNLDYPTELWVEWAVSALLILILVLAAARAAPLVTTAEGWQRINQWVDELRPQQESAGVPSGSTGGVSTGLSGENSQPERELQPPDVNLVGTPIEQGNETVMRVRVSGSTSFHWRSEIYSVYTGRGWEEAALLPSLEPSSEPPAGYNALRQEFMLNGGYKGRLFAAGDPYISENEGVSILGLAGAGPGISDGASFILVGDSRHYQVTAWVPDMNQLPNSSAVLPLPQSIVEQYLQLPPDLPVRVRTLAERIVQDPADSFEAAVRVQNYLREVIPYDLNTPPPPSGRDVVDYFLFEAPSGFCSYYASAMAVLLRTQGIPARVVTGYANGEFDQQTQIYRVPASNAHAWVEVYFTGYGWLPFEPTPSQNTPAYNEKEEMDLLVEQELSPQQWLNRRRWVFTLVGLLVLGFVGLAAWFFVRFNKRKRKIRFRGQHPAVMYYGLLVFRLQLAGVVYPDGLTPREFLQRNDPLAEKYGHLWAGLRAATQSYEQAVYSQHPPQPQDLRNLKKLIQRGLWDWGCLWIRTTWDRFRRSLRKRFKPDLR